MVCVVHALRSVMAGVVVCVGALDFTLVRDVGTDVGGNVVSLAVDKPISTASLHQHPGSHMVNGYEQQDFRAAVSVLLRRQHIPLSLSSVRA